MLPQNKIQKCLEVINIHWRKQCLHNRSCKSKIKGHNTSSFSHLATTKSPTPPPHNRGVRRTKKLKEKKGRQLILFLLLYYFIINITVIISIGISSVYESQCLQKQMKATHASNGINWSSHFWNDFYPFLQKMKTEKWNGACFY